MKSRIKTAMVLVGLAVGVELSAAELPQLRIPKISKPPVLDGQLAPGEWDGAAAEEPMAKVRRLTAVAQLVPVPRGWLAEQLGVPLAETEETTKDTKDTKEDGEPLQAYDPDQPRNEQGRFADDGGDAPEDARIAAMYDAAIESNNKEYLNFGVIDTRAAKRLSKPGGPDLQGCTHRIESDAIRHIINEHGDPGKAARRGGLPVIRSEIARVPYYLRTADSVKEEGGSLVWQKRINGKVIILEEIRDSHRRLAVKTMKIRREKA